MRSRINPTASKVTGLVLRTGGLASSPVVFSVVCYENNPGDPSAEPVITPDKDQRAGAHAQRRVKDPTPTDRTNRPSPTKPNRSVYNVVLRASTGRSHASGPHATWRVMTGYLLV